MNIILKIILFNIVLFIILKYSIILFFILLLLFSLYLFYIYNNINNLVEGQIDLENYKMSFVSLLNDDKKYHKEDMLYDKILDNFTKLLSLMERSEGKIPPNQMCIGEFGEWSDCSKDCGRGEKTRMFNVIQKAGVNGIKCIYENGEIESKECFDRLCKFNEECENNFDCISGMCNQKDELCSYPNMCNRDQIYNCNFEQCQELNRQFGEYLYDENKHECVNKVINIKYEDFEINEETSELVESEIEFVRENKIDSIINNIKELCKNSGLTAAQSDSDENISCSEYQPDNCEEDDEQCKIDISIDCGNKYEVLNHENSENSKNIPCIYNSKTASCESIEEHYDYLINNNVEPYSDITKIDLRERYTVIKNAQYSDNTDNVFSCPQP